MSTNTRLSRRAFVLSSAAAGTGLALGIEIAMVATHHLFRLFLIVLTGPLVFRAFLQRAP